MKTTRSLRVGYMGTPDFALSALKAIHGAGHDVVCVYSQPPRPKGRGHKVQPSRMNLPMRLVFRSLTPYEF